MKRKMIAYMLLLLLFLMGVSCKKESNSSDNIDSISPESQKQMIDKNINGIDFRFYLLDENNKPSTVFNEGENFEFYFSVTNQSDRKINFDAGFVQTNYNSFCEVFNSDGHSLGKPFVFKGVALIGEGAYSFNKAEAKIFRQKWSDDRNNAWTWMYGN